MVWNSLAEKEGEDTTDSDSDNDIFFVGASLDGEKYKLVRDGYTTSGVISPFYHVQCHVFPKVYD